MLDAEKTPNVVEACNKPRLYDNLEDIQKRYMYMRLYIPTVVLCMCVHIVYTVVMLYHCALWHPEYCVYMHAELDSHLMRL